MQSGKFHTRDTYICNAALEDCVNLLKSKSGELLNPQWHFPFGRKVRISISNNQADQYEYIIQTRLNYRNIILGGYLERIDDHHTKIIVRKSSLLWIIIVTFSVLVMILTLTASIF